MMHGAALTIGSERGKLTHQTAHEHDDDDDDDKDTGASARKHSAHGLLALANVSEQRGERRRPARACSFRKRVNLSSSSGPLMEMKLAPACSPKGDNLVKGGGFAPLRRHLICNRLGQQRFAASEQSTQRL